MRDPVCYILNFLSAEDHGVAIVKITGRMPIDGMRRHITLAGRLVPTGNET